MRGALGIGTALLASCGSSTEMRIIRIPCDDFASVSLDYQDTYVAVMLCRSSECQQSGAWWEDGEPITQTWCLGQDRLVVAEFHWDPEDFVDAESVDPQEAFPLSYWCQSLTGKEQCGFGLAGISESGEAYMYTGAQNPLLGFLATTEEDFEIFDVDSMTRGVEARSDIALAYECYDRTPEGFFNCLLSSTFRIKDGTATGQPNAYVDPWFLVRWLR